MPAIAYQDYSEYVYTVIVKDMAKPSAEIQECPNCHAQIKDGMFNSVEIFIPGKVDIINEYHSPQSPAYCTKCGSDLYYRSSNLLNDESEKVITRIQQIIHYIPIVTIQSPYNWEYEVLGMVTGQSTTGTGVISEFNSSFADLFGAQANRLSNKLRSGEQLCEAQLRKRTLDLGGNAILGADIDYSEIGSEKGLLMVCMAGTAVRVTNMEIFGISLTYLNELSRLIERERHLSNLIKNALPFNN